MLLYLYDFYYVAVFIRVSYLQVRALEKVRIVCIACSSRDSHTLAAGDNNSLWAWGDNKYGKLGVKDKGSSDVPIQIMMFPSGISQIECGMHFSILLTKDGNVYSWYVH